MYRDDPFALPEHLAGISDAGFWSPLEKAALMRSTVGVIGAAHPLTHPAYQRALANFRTPPDERVRPGQRPVPLTRVLGTANKSGAERTYFVTGAVLAHWKIRTSKTGQRGEFTLEAGSRDSVRCVMWSDDLKRHTATATLPEVGSLVVAAGRLEMRTFRRTEIDEATGDEVTVTHRRYTATVNRLWKVGDPVRGELNRAEAAYRSREWWHALDTSAKAAVIQKGLGFALTPSPSATTGLAPDALRGPGAEYAAGVSLALGILRETRAGTWTDLVAAMRAAASRTATRAQADIADRMSHLSLTDDQMSLLVLPALEFVRFTPRCSVAICDTCGFDIPWATVGTPSKCKAIPHCPGRLSKRAQPAKAVALAATTPSKPRAHVRIQSRAIAL